MTTTASLLLFFYTITNGVAPTKITLIQIRLKRLLQWIYSNMKSKTSLSADVLIMLRAYRACAGSPGRKVSIRTRV